jgi:hypothetical protein
LRLLRSAKNRKKAGFDAVGLQRRVIIEGSAQDGRQLKLSGVLVAAVVDGVRGFGGGWVDRVIGWVLKEASKKFGGSSKTV